MYYNCQNDLFIYWDLTQKDSVMIVIPIYLMSNQNQIDLYFVYIKNYLENFNLQIINYFINLYSHLYYYNYYEYRQLT